MVGSGEEIDIVGQPWLMDTHNPFITSNLMVLRQNKVCTLMATDHRGWDEDILREFFNERDQQCIGSIQLGDSMEHDTVYWSKKSSGNYSVRIAYRILQAQKYL